MLGSVLVVLALVGAACGSSDDPDEGATSAIEVEAEATDTSEAEAETTDSTEAEDAPATVTVTQFRPTSDDGEAYGPVDIEVPYKPETIVVMDLGILLTLDALGVEADGFGSLGTPVPDAYAAVVEGPESVGTAWEPDFEAINALEPDLIIVATRSSSQYEAMAEIATTVDLTQPGEGEFFQEFSEVHETIGQIFGLEAEVEVALGAIEDGIAEVAAQTATAGDALVLMTSGTEVSAFGPGSWRFGLVHDIYGYGAAEESLERDATHGEAVSFEFIANAEPDVLFVVDRGAAIGEEGEAAAEVLDNELVAGTPAWQSERVVYADSFAWYLANNSIPGFLQTTEDMKAGLGGAGGGEATEDEAAAMAAFAVVFDSAADYADKADYLEDAENLETSNTAYTEGGEAMGGIALDPTAALVDGDSAVITYDVYFGENAAYTDLERSIERVDGVWTVSRDSYCDFLAQARTPCES